MGGGWKFKFLHLPKIGVCNVRNSLVFSKYEGQRRIVITDTWRENSNIIHEVVLANNWRLVYSSSRLLTFSFICYKFIYCDVLYNIISVYTITVLLLNVNLQAVILWPNRFVTRKLQTGETRVTKVILTLQNITWQQYFNLAKFMLLQVFIVL